MNLRTTVLTLTALSLSLAPLGAAAEGPGAAAQVRANVEAHASTSVRANTGENRIAQAKDRADREIDRRIENLNKFTTRVNAMKRLSSDDQTALSATIQGQIDSLTALKAQIDADDSTTTLRADIQSIAKSYRIYALVLPQAAVIAAAERAMNVANLMEQFSTKLSERIASASSSDATLQSTLEDYDAKVADAKAQAQAAIDAAAALQPDNGDQSVFQSNLAALKDARSKVQAAQQDLVAARKDAGAIIKALGGGTSMHGEAHATTSAAE